MASQMICFICECGFVFYSMSKTDFSKAENGDFWHTAQGYCAKCPKCGGYAREHTVPIFCKNHTHICGEDSADYWRGKYDAYKELYENKNNGEPNG